MDNTTNSIVGEFFINNAKTIVTFIIFVCGLYIQYQASMMRLDQMEKEIASLKKASEIEAQRLLGNTGLKIILKLEEQNSVDEL